VVTADDFLADFCPDQKVDSGAVNEFNPGTEQRVPEQSKAVAKWNNFLFCRYCRSDVSREWHEELTIEIFDAVIVQHPGSFLVWPPKF